RRAVKKRGKGRLRSRPFPRSEKSSGDFAGFLAAEASDHALAGAGDTHHDLRLVPADLARAGHGLLLGAGRNVRLTRLILRHRGSPLVSRAASPAADTNGNYTKTPIRGLESDLSRGSGRSLDHGYYK